MIYNPVKQCVTNDDGSTIEPTVWRSVGNTVSCSLAARFPLGCDEARAGWCSHMPARLRAHRGYVIPGGEYECYQAHKRGERWRAYLRKELAKGE